ncbi:MAG: CTAG/PCC1 family protein [Desulfurococcaceae archaeon]
MNISVEYELEASSEKLLESIFVSLTPELGNLPGNCTGRISRKEGKLNIKLECSDAGKLRALNNSFIGVLVMLLELAGEIRNG